MTNLRQSPRHTRGQHPVEQVLALLLLLAQLARALRDQVLQVVAVLLQHLHHLVHDVVLHPLPQRLQPVPYGSKVRPEREREKKSFLYLYFR